MTQMNFTILKSIVVLLSIKKAKRGCYLMSWAMKMEVDQKVSY